MTLQILQNKRNFEQYKSFVFSNENIDIRHLLRNSAHSRTN